MDNILNEILLEKNKFKSERWVSKNYPDFHFFICSKFESDISWKEKLFLYINKLDVPSRCVCGNMLKFSKGKYRTFCSVKCASNNNSIKSKRRITCIEKYGVDNPMKNASVRETLKKSIIDKYGVDNTSKLDFVKEKVKISNNIRYGVDYISQLDNTKEKLRTSLLINSSKMIEKRNEGISSAIQDKIDIFNLKFISILETSVYEIECSSNHTFTIHKNTLNDRIKNKNTICTICNPIDSSSDAQRQLLHFIEDNYNGEIISNDRSIIGQELDIYLPELKISFEYNGVYWHSDAHKEKDYHYNKTQMCIESDIHLIHIWEDDWIQKQDIVKSRILNLLGSSNRIWARNCQVREINSVESSLFLEKNHIQGNVFSSIRIGLYHKSNLVGLMTFGKLRKSLGQKDIDNHYELLRFCNILDTSIVGGASKLFSFFIKNYKPIRVISYADRCWSNGNLYKRLGFKLESITRPNYYYVVNGSRKNRYSFRKDRLVAMGYDKSKSESVIMKELGYNKIFDSGNLKFSYNTTIDIK